MSETKKEEIPPLFYLIALTVAIVVSVFVGRKVDKMFDSVDSGLQSFQVECREAERAIDDFQVECDEVIKRNEEASKRIRELYDE